MYEYLDISAWSENITLKRFWLARHIRNTRQTDGGFVVEGLIVRQVFEISALRLTLWFARHHIGFGLGHISGAMSSCVITTEPDLIIRPYNIIITWISSANKMLPLSSPSFSSPFIYNVNLHKYKTYTIYRQITHQTPATSHDSPWPSLSQPAKLCDARLEITMALHNNAKLDSLIGWKHGIKHSVWRNLSA